MTERRAVSNASCAPLLLVIGIVLAGCAGTGADRELPPTAVSARDEPVSLRPGLAGGPDTTCARFGRLFLSLDTRTDRSAADARARAAKAAGTIPLQALILDTLRVPPKDLTWAERSRRGVRVEATPIPYAGGALTPDSSRRAHRAVSFELEEVNADGTRVALPELVTVFCSLTPADGDYGWLVDQVQLGGGPG